MDSAGETQQPSYRVRAHLPVTVQSTSSLPTDTTPYNGHGEGLDTSAGSVRWSQSLPPSHGNTSFHPSHQPATVTTGDRGTVIEAHDLSNEDSKNSSASAGPGPSTLARWKVASSPSLKLAQHSSHPDLQVSEVSEEFDELQSDPSSRRQIASFTEHDALSAPTPPEALDTEQKDRKQITAPLSISNNASNVTPRKEAPPHTPSRHRPLSAFKPPVPTSKWKLEPGISPVEPRQADSPTRSIVRKPTSLKKGQSPSSESDEESFGMEGAQFTPRTRLALILDKSNRKAASPSHKKAHKRKSSPAMSRHLQIDIATQREDDEQNVDEAGQETVEKTGIPEEGDNDVVEEESHLASFPARPDDPPTDRQYQTQAPAPNEAISARSGHNTVIDSPSPITARFGDLPSSSGMSSEAHRSAFFSSQRHDIGDDPSQATMNFPATQAVTRRVPSAENLGETMSHTSENPPVDNMSTVDATHVLEQPSTDTPEVSAALFISAATPRPTSQTSNNSGNVTDIPHHRRLMRVNPRHGIAKGIHPAASMPAKELTKQRASAVPRSDPMPSRILPDIEPTQVNESSQNRSSSHPQSSQHNIPIAHTFVDDAPMSPPPDARADLLEAPHTLPPHSSPPPSSPTRSLPKAVDHAFATQLQPTYVDPRTLPSQAPPPKPTPRKYGRAKHRQVRSSPVEEDHLKAGPSNLAQQEENLKQDTQLRVSARSSYSPDKRQAAVQKGVGDTHITAANVVASGKRTKRKRSISSDFTTGDHSGSESSSAPADPDDYTYRPTPKLNGTASRKGKGKGVNGEPTIKDRKTRETTSSASSKEVKSKKVKVVPALQTPDVDPKPGKWARRSKQTSTLTPLISSQPLPIRVWGWWPPMKSFYAGTVTAKVGKQYHVDFDDGYEGLVELDRLRRLELKAGEVVKGDPKRLGKGVLEVEENWSDGQGGVKIKQDGESIGLVAIVELFVALGVVKKSFDDRVLAEEDLSVPEDPVRTSRISKVNGRVSADTFSGRIFMVTSSSKTVTTEQGILVSQIKENGGQVVDDWASLFERPSDGFGSVFKTKQPPFLIVLGGESMKPKVIAALARGIPMLAESYIVDAMDDVSQVWWSPDPKLASSQANVDWRSYLVSPGYSTHLGYHTSQMVDPNWGEETWKSAHATSFRRPFKDMDFLFLVPQGVSGTLPEIRQLVPFCLHALGAKSLKQIKQVTHANSLSKYHMILIEDRCAGQVIPDTWEKSGKLCNFGWLKQCIISGMLLPPQVVKEK